MTTSLLTCIIPSCKHVTAAFCWQKVNSTAISCHPKKIADYILFQQVHFTSSRFTCAKERHCVFFLTKLESRFHSVQTWSKPAASFHRHAILHSTIFQLNGCNTAASHSHSGITFPPKPRKFTSHEHVVQNCTWAQSLKPAIIYPQWWKINLACTLSQSRVHRATILKSHRQGHLTCTFFHSSKPPPGSPNLRNTSSNPPALSEGPMLKRK